MYGFITFIAVMLLLFPFVIISSFFGRIKGGNMIFRICMLWADIWFPLVFIYIKRIYEASHDASRQYVFVTNHISYLDSAVLLTIASASEIEAIVSLRNKAAQQLTQLYSSGHWSYECTPKSIATTMTAHSTVFISYYRNRIAGTLRLATKKPWAIDTGYFTPVNKTLYLTDMAIDPALQRKGIGSFMLQEIKSFVLAWPAQSIRLDAYDHPAGAAGFYHKCGFIEKGKVIYRGTPLVYFEKLY